MSFCINGKMLKSNFNFGKINPNSEKWNRHANPLLKSQRKMFGCEENAWLSVTFKVNSFFSAVFNVKKEKEKRQETQEKRRNRTYLCDSWASTRTSHCPLRQFSPTAPLSSSFPETQGCVYQLHWPHPPNPSASLSSSDCRWEVSRGRPISKLPHHLHPLKNGRKPPHQSSSIWKNCPSLNYHRLYKFHLLPLQHETRNPPAKPTKTQKPFLQIRENKPKFWTLELKSSK